MKKLLALTLSLLMVFTVIPMVIVSAETNYTYKTVFDADTSDGTGIGLSYNARYQKTPANSIIDVSIGDHTKALYLKKDSAYDGYSAYFSDEFREYAKDAIGIKFWMAGDDVAVSTGKKVSVGFESEQGMYKLAGEKQNNIGPATAEGTEYTILFSNYSKAYKFADPKFNASYISYSTSSVFTEKFLGKLKKIYIGVDEATVSSAEQRAGYYIDDIQLIFPENHTFAPLEYTASFLGTDTAVLKEAVADITADYQNNDSLVLPTAELTENEFAGWVTEKDTVNVITANTTVNLADDITYYAVSASRPTYETPSAPNVTTVTFDSVTLTAMGSNYVYSKDGSTWQTSNVFSNLLPSTEYTFYQKIGGNTAYLESAVSAGTTVTTNDVSKFIFSSTYVTLSDNTAGVSFATNDGYPNISKTGLTAGVGVTLTTKYTVAPGVYNLTLWARAFTGRAPIDIDVNGVVVAESLDTSKDASNSQGANKSFPLKSIAIPKTTVLTIKFTTTGSGSLYLNALELTKTDDYTTELTSAVATDAAASIRLGDVNGIRFYTAVDEEALAALTGGADYEIGTIVAPANLLGTYGELTHAIGEENFAEIKYEAKAADGNIEYYNADQKEIVGSLVGIKDTNISRKFIARAYVKFGETYYYSTTTSTRSLQAVALAMQSDSANFEQLTADQQAMVNAWAAGNPVTVE